MRNLNLKQLRAVQAIKQHGTIVAAANALGLTPPAVTIQLKLLEEDAEIVLFDRTNEGLRPTAAGLAFLDAAQMIEERLRLLNDEIDALKGLRTGSLSLGVVSTAKYFAPQMMATFAKDHPDIAVKLIIGNRAEIIESLKSHSVDLALMGRPPRDVPLRSAVFGDHPLVMIAAPDHPLASSRDITKERIARENFLIRESGSGTRISLEIFLSELPGRLDDLGTEMSSNETIKQAVMAGLGVAFISAHTIALELEVGRLVILDVIGMPIRRQWFSVVRTDRTMSPAMQAFQNFLARKGAQCLPSIDRLYPFTGT
ncbi:LysR substrate-binding domain-containing protein [Phyllobacterium sp. 21LDTY02-6]|jgi:LysR family transcriptional regulator, low CO2-responsive transcriptional regulator|uniref:LysR family transcriptional regulator n=1 Tax=unclassified Phyllobacterium TaxID=2638441 RepID=UPI002021E3D6|nr:MULTISPECIES: LysR family transcriptional regulator [unclassified Phyllobacterium]MCO4318163.1 LysR substrate-binding domain-containing protein [Phyllobacterium sp. 21LDTY02-6]MCX8280157.1 LysR substrate-binding domain-containing protein [Phyllobacterium sp. 0TCS1.6C]MCX8294281.1 LysR substrate-binding domain-containing protein [Phyllobacterium sp. 0TCS1.6A]